MERIKEAFPDPGWPVHRVVADGLGAFHINNHFTGRRWCEVSGKALSYALEEGGDFEEAAFFYFLPAWLTWFVKGYLTPLRPFASFYLSQWIEEFRPFSDYGCTRKQIQVIRDVLQFIIDTDHDPEQCKKERYAMKLLDKELTAS